MKWNLIALAVVSLVGLEQTPSGEQASRPADQSRVIVHMKHYTDDLHSAYMALELAERLQSHGSQVTMLLDLEGARFASGEPRSASIQGPGSRTLSETFEAFQKGGGRAIVCRHCAEQVGIPENQVRKGIEPLSFDEIAIAVMSADKIIEY